MNNDMIKDIADRIVRAKDPVRPSAPVYLVDNLRLLCNSLRPVIELEEVYPNRKDQRSSLSQLSGLTMDQALATDVHTLAIHHDSNSARNQVSKITLEEMQENAKQFVSTISTTGGKQKAWIRPGNLSAKETCALIIVVACQIYRGREPGADTDSVHKIADDLWIAAGGRSMGEERHGTSLAGWRRHLNKVKTDKSDQMRLRRATLQAALEPPGT